MPQAIRPAWSSWSDRTGFKRSTGVGIIRSLRFTDPGETIALDIHSENSRPYGVRRQPVMEILTLSKAPLKRPG